MSEIKLFPFSIDELKDYLLVSDITENQIISSLMDTHRGFTSARDSVNKYTEEIIHVSSYSMFYMPSDFPKLSMVLSQLNPEVTEFLSRQKVSIFDIGCGPGTFSFAWHNFFTTSPHSFNLLDKSAPMLHQAKVFAEKVFNLPNAKFLGSFPKKLISENQNSIRVVIFGHSINEMGLDLANNYIESIDPDFIFMLGPGTPKVFESYMKWKSNYVSSKKYTTLYPCINMQTCPMSERESDWCHQVLRAKLPKDLHILCQKLAIDRRSVSFTCHLHCRNSFNFSNDHANYTIVQFLGETKFSWRYRACPIGGRDIVELELMKKLLSPEAKVKINSLAAGCRVYVQEHKVLSPTHIRGVIN